MKPRICVCIGQQSEKDTMADAKQAALQADVVEIRLDLMNTPRVAPFLTEIDTPLLFTNRAQWEGGKFQGAEHERISPLMEAVDAGAAYVDLELLSPQPSWQLLKEKAAESQTMLICSWHDFQGTPNENELIDRVERMQASGANIGKIVTMASNHLDVLRVLGLLKYSSEKNFPLIAFCMGEVGVVSRLATTELGGYMTYCAPDKGEGTASGQVGVTILRSLFSQLGVES